MKRTIMLALIMSYLCIPTTTFAMNSEFQKPDDALEDDVYATPAEEDSGEVIEVDPVAPAPQPEQQVEEPSEQAVTPAEPTEAEVEIETPTQSENSTQLQAEDNASEQPIVETTETEEPEQNIQSSSNDITPVTTPSDGQQSDVVIEQSNNFWLFGIAGGTALLIILLLLLQRSRKNNSH